MTEGLKSAISSVGLYQIFNPLALRALPLYFAAQNTGGEVETYSLFVSVPFLYVKPRKATGHGRGRV